MKLALIQEKQNSLYQFKDSALRYTPKEVVKLQAEMIRQNFDLIRKAAEEKADLVLTSEAINFPGQPFRCQKDTRQIILETQDAFWDDCSRFAAAGKLYLAAGMFRVKADGRMYNSTVIFDREGKEIFSYDKNFLAGDENEYLTPGNGFPIWESEFGKIGIGICWDMQFPETARSYALQGADLILCPSWGWEHLYGPARAYENGIYVACAMAVPSWKPIEGKRSPSQVIAPDGTVLAEGSQSEAEAVFCRIADIQDCARQRAFRIGELKRQKCRQI